MSSSVAWAGPRSRRRSSVPPRASPSSCSTRPTRTTCGERISDDLEHTVVVVSSKSGSTVETDSQRRAYEQAFTRGRDRPRCTHRRRHGSGEPARRRGPSEGLSRRQCRSRRRRTLLGADRLRSRAERARGSGRLGPARRGGVGRRPARRRRRRQPGPSPGGRPGGHGPAPGQARPRRRRLRDPGLRRLGRAAHRRVHRQERHGPAPRRRAVGGGPRGPVARERRPRRPSRGGRRRDPPERRQRPRRRDARRPAAALGGGHRRGGATARDQPVRPAGRRVGQAGRSRAARPGCRLRPARPPSSTGPSRSGQWGATGWDYAATVDEAVEALLGQLARTRLRRGDGLPRPARRCRAGRVPTGARQAHGAADDLRLGAALPPLDRAVPQGRTAPWASTSRSPPPRARTFRCPGRDFTFGDVHRVAGRRRRPGARRPRATGAAAAPDRPRRRTGPGSQGPPGGGRG